MPVSDRFLNFFHHIFQKLGFVLLVWLFAAIGLASPLAAQDLTFAAFQEQDSGRLTVRLDPDAENPAPTNLTGIEISLDGGPEIALKLAPRPRFERTIVSLNDPVTRAVQSVRLRPITTTGPGRWSEAGPVTQIRAGAADINPVADDAWEWRPHPTRPDVLQLRLLAWPLGAADQFSGIAIRTNFQDTGMILAPVADRWLDLPLDPDSFGRGRDLDVYVAPVSGSKRARWSPPKPARLSWVGTPLAPEPLWSTDWMVRETGVPGEILIDLRQPPDGNGNRLIGIRAQIAPVDDQFVATGPVSDWQDLPYENSAEGGAVRLSGLDDGQRYLVALRGVSEVGAGRPSSPKMVTPRAFGFRTDAIIGDMNTAGQARIRVPRGSQISEGNGWEIIAGDDWDWLVPTGRIDAASGTVTLASGTRIAMTLQADSFVAGSLDDLAAFLALPASEKSGTTLFIGPDWMETQKISAAFDAAFDDLTAPLTILPREADLGTQLSGWQIGSRNSGARTGALIFRDIDFFHPEALWSWAGNAREMTVIQTRFSRSLVSDLTFENVAIRSDAMPARLGYRQRVLIRASDFEHAANVRFLDSEIAYIVYGIRVGLVDSLTRGNTMHHLIADPININMSAGSQGRNVVVEHNTAFDFMGDGFFLHGDGTHMWVHGGGGTAPARVEGLSYRGNVFFPGWEGIAAPPSLSALFEFAAGAGDMTISSANDHQLIRLDATDGPVTVTLPPMSQTAGIVQRRDKELVFAIQKGDRGPHAVILRAAAGETIGATGQQEVAITTPFQAIELRARPQEAAWFTHFPVPALQGFYADQRGTELPGLEIEANIFWGLSVRQLSPGNSPQGGARVHHNAVLMPLPGDLDGDGQWNTAGDGVTRKAGQILVQAADQSVSVFDNIAGRTEFSDQSGENPVGWNNIDLNWGTAGEGIAAQFAAAKQMDANTPDAIFWFPLTRQEAIDMARPAPDSTLAASGAGPLGATAQTDWWDYTAGTRSQRAATGTLTLISTEPAIPSQDAVSTQTQSLRLEFNAPLSPAQGRISLIASDALTPEVVWSLDGSDPNVTQSGPTIQLRLPAPLRDGISYSVLAPSGALQDIWGRSWDGIPAKGWTFEAAGNVALNLLDTTDVTQSPWQLSGLRAAPAPSGDGMFRLTGTDRVSRLRIAFDTVAAPQDLLSLRFEYWLQNPGSSAVSHLNGETAVRIDWNKVPVGRVDRIAPGLWGTRTDVGAENGLPPRTAYQAELILDPAVLSSRIDLDVLRAIAVDSSIDVGRFSLVARPR